MAQITFTIPDGKVSMVKSWLLSKFQDEWTRIEVANPGWTDLQIAKEVIRSWMVDQVHKHKRMVAGDSAENAVVKDDEIVG